jgi:hypothetical protein
VNSDDSLLFFTRKLGLGGFSDGCLPKQGLTGAWLACAAREISTTSLTAGLWVLTMTTGLIQNGLVGSILFADESLHHTPTS